MLVGESLASAWFLVDVGLQALSLRVGGGGYLVIGPTGSGLV